jgi:hypothetical protein
VVPISNDFRGQIDFKKCMGINQPDKTIEFRKD